VATLYLIVNRVTRSKIYVPIAAYAMLMELYIGDIYKWARVEL